MKPKYFANLLRFLVLLLALYGALILWDAIRGGDSIFSGKNAREPAGPAYSFETDSDADGLSNATELAIGSNPENPNTDGDEFSDSEELLRGYDPVRAGTVRLADREHQTETIRFLAWASGREDRKADSLADTGLISRYLRETVGTSTLPAASPQPISKTIATNLETITTYLYSMSLAPIPEDIANYARLAQAVQVTGNAAPIEDITRKIASLEESYGKLVVPSEAIAIHREYLLLAAQLKTVFSDLRHAREDPVLIAKNLVLGQILADKAAALEIVKRELGASIRLQNRPSL